MFLGEQAALPNQAKVRSTRQREATGLKSPPGEVVDG